MTKDAKYTLGSFVGFLIALAITVASNILLRNIGRLVMLSVIAFLYLTVWPERHEKNGSVCDFAALSTMIWLIVFCVLIFLGPVFKEVD